MACRVRGSSSDRAVAPEIALPVVESLYPGVVRTPTLGGAARNPVPSDVPFRDTEYVCVKF